MRGRKGMRDRWLRAVLRADADDLTNAVKLVCVALHLWMDDTGRVTANRQDVADAVGWETKQRVSDRLREARQAGFLDVVAGGKNGRPVTYDAMIPAKYRQPGTPSRGTPGNGSRGTSNGVPAHAEESDGRYPATGHQYARARARATSETRHSEPAPAGIRGSRPRRSRNSSSNGKRARRLSLVAACPSAPTTRTGDERPCA